MKTNCSSDKLYFLAKTVQVFLDETTNYKVRATVVTHKNNKLSE